MRRLNNAQLEWDDYHPEGISDIAKRLRIVFTSLLPINSRKSFDFHFSNYLNQFISIDKKATIIEEEERFLKYIRVQYNLN